MFLNKKLHFGLSMIFLIILFGCGASKTDMGTNGNGNKVIELNVNNWASSTHHYGYNVFEPWKELVEERTDGRVKVNLYHGAALGQSSSLYQDVRGGLYDVGLVVTTYFYDTNFFPYTIGNLPFALPDPESASNVLGKFGEKYANEGLNDVITMGPTSTDAYDLFSTKQIKSVDDLKKLKIRVTGKSEAEFIKAIGGIPVTLSSELVYEGLEKHTVDATFYTPIGAHGLKLYEPAPHIAKIKAFVNPVMPIMNKDFYEQLPEDLKKLFDEELNPKLTELFTDSYQTELKVTYEKLEEEVSKRGEISTISDKEAKRFKERSKTVWDAWVKDANDRGYPGEEMVEDFFAILQEEGYPLPY